MYVARYMVRVSTWYQLVSHVRHFELAHVNWATKSAEEKQKLFSSVLLQDFFYLTFFFLCYVYNVINYTVVFYCVLFELLVHMAQFGHRAFSVCSPTIWSSLPKTLHLTDNYQQFCWHLKTRLFNLAFN